MLVLEKTNAHPPFVVRVHGKLLLPGDNCARDQGIMFGQQPDTNRAIMAPCYPVNKYQCLAHPGNNQVVHADAVLLSKPGESIAFATTDCGVMLLSAANTGDIVLVHPGRNQLMDREYPGTRRSIIEAAVSTLIERGATRVGLHAVTLTQIRAEHFGHDPDHPYAETLKHQAKLWGEDILSNPAALTLDLSRLSFHQLVHYGVPPEHIKSTNNNPYTSPDLASKRAGKPGSNLVVVERKK